MIEFLNFFGGMSLVMLGIVGVFFTIHFICETYDWRNKTKNQISDLQSRVQELENKEQ